MNRRLSLCSPKDKYQQQSTYFLHKLQILMSYIMIFNKKKAEKEHIRHVKRAISKQSLDAIINQIIKDSTLLRTEESFFNFHP